jgi:hypothetical protein
MKIPFAAPKYQGRHFTVSRPPKRSASHYQSTSM